MCSRDGSVSKQASLRGGQEEQPMSQRIAPSLKPFLAPWRRGTSARRKAGRTRSQPLLEILEERTVPATFNPTTFADGTGAGTLRNAIMQANSNGQDNTIILSSGTYTLSPAAGGELALTG